MKVKLSKQIDDFVPDLEYPCLLTRGKEVILVISDYSEGIVIESPTLETGEPMDCNGDWTSEGWVLYEGTVTLSNK